jgi:hypothetical protein
MNKKPKSAKTGPQRNQKMISDALREEAELSWARTARKANRAKQRTQARVTRRKHTQKREAEIQSLQRKLKVAQRELLRRSSS